ncbi:hypothetical protein QFW77_04495 [Luteimonas sp. RD2P54]|uniref:Uncharacterized protein n=1 Tax=Luteimonas endophytica TaxID=3042023 RepID=A0ABT6J7S2_9GAMM|nr:hypothetical protein [Luteimonas endophytica]MDH5822248.1 hypothetical protein [Luteimonas endophytica]
MNDIGFEFDAVATPPACGPAEWASVAGVDGHVAEPGRAPQVEGDATGTGSWIAAQSAPLRAWWDPRPLAGTSSA